MRSTHKKERTPSRLQQKSVSPVTLYSAISFGCLFLLLVSFLLSRGELIERYFFYDTRDTAMDFLHSIEYTRGRRPYELYNTLYPPLANLFFYGIYLTVPRGVTRRWGSDFYESLSLRGTNLDLRTQQVPLLSYLVFLMIIVMLLFALMEYALRDKKQGQAKAAAMAMVLSYGCLNAVERGNIVILSAAASLFFVLHFKSENRILKECALISLAVSAGLKLYPALFGILLIKKKDWGAVFRAIIYGVASVILPLFAFGGFSELKYWLGSLKGFTVASELEWLGTGMQSFLANVSRYSAYYFGIHIPVPCYSVLTYAVILVLLASSLFLKKTWQSAMALTLPMVLLQSQGDYALCFFLIPLILFMQEEKLLTQSNCIPFFGLTVLTVNIPVFYEYGVSYPRNSITQGTLIACTIWCAFEMIRQISWRLENERQHSN